MQLLNASTPRVLVGWSVKPHRMEFESPLRHMSDKTEVKSRAPRVVLDFHNWVVREGWCRRVGSNGTTYHRSDTHNQWPPDEEVTENELLIKYFGF